MVIGGVRKLANIFLPTQNVGSPCDTFSQAPGSARHNCRSRFNGLGMRSPFCSDANISQRSVPRGFL